MPISQVPFAGISNPVDFRNIVINGDMQVDQRNNGSSVSVNGGAVYTLDRFLCQDNTDGSFSIQQSTTAPTYFKNSMVATITATDSSLTTTQFGRIVQRIEGQNIINLGFGTASAKNITLSFYVRSSVTGTFGGSIVNSDGNRVYVFSYTISVADTFEYKTISIPGDTSGTWLTTNGTGIEINFGLGAGPDRSVAAGSWGTSLAYNVTGATNLFATSAATLYITGVQLEAGEQASGFEFMPFDIDLMRCQRYYYKLFPGSNNRPFGIGLAYNTNVLSMFIGFSTTMRTAPSALEQSGTASHYNIIRAGGGDTCTSVPTFVVATVYAAQVDFNVSGTLTAGTAVGGWANDAAAYLAWSAEL